MATTPNFSLRYPLSSDPVDVSNDLYKLATDSDTTLGTMLPKAGGTLTGNVTISKSSPILNLTAAAATHAILRLDSPAGYASDIALRSGTSNRWTFSKLNEAETGSDAGSNFVLYRYLDSGSYAEAIRITRATGLMTLTGDLTLNKNGGAFNLTAAAGSSLSLRMQTGGTNRWVLYKTSEAESGSDAGSNFQLYKYTDAGAGSVALEITRSTGAATFSSTVQATNLYVNGAAAASAGMQIWTAGYLRWNIRKENTSETGSNVGSDLVINRYDDAGANQGVAFRIARDTGKTTLGSVGATAGLELGSSGPRMMSGTGSPESVVTAPVGSIWIDTAATTGAIQWIKATGTGNTGWVVEYGDTGWRDLTTLLVVDATRTIGQAPRVRRVGERVYFAGVWANTGTPFRQDLLTLPTSFRPTLGLYQRVDYDATDTPYYRSLYVPASGAIKYGGPANGSNFEYQHSWSTIQPWPTSLPGTAI